MEKWKGRGLSETVIDLTSLLDVIFIVLFLVMQRTGGVARQATEQAAELQGLLDQREAEIEVLTGETALAQGMLRSYQQLADTAVLVTVWVTPDADGSGRREIVVSWGVDDTEFITLTWRSMQTAEGRLRARLTELLALREEVPFFITFRYDGDTIYRRDYVMVRDTLEDLRSDHRDVYLAFDELGQGTAPGGPDAQSADKE